MRALYKRLGIETGLTTAYHPEGNGKVERKNQEVEQYLRLFTNKRQDDWATHLPAAEFALNSRVILEQPRLRSKSFTVTCPTSLFQSASEATFLVSTSVSNT